MVLQKDAHDKLDRTRDEQRTLHRSESEKQ